MNAKRILSAIGVAKEISRSSTCLRAQTGAVIIDEQNHIISTGYSGAASGFTDCLERGFCKRQDLGCASGEGYEYCYSVHAEENAMLQAGRDANGCILVIYCGDGNGYERVMKPCWPCTRRIIQCGIKTIIVANNTGGYTVTDPVDLYNEYEARLETYNGFDN